MGRQRAAEGVQIHGFAGFRRAGVIDALGSRPAAATLQAAVQRSLGAPRSRGARTVTHAMFERFTEKAIKVVMLAQEEARRLGELRAGLSGTACQADTCCETSSALERSCVPCMGKQNNGNALAWRSAGLPPHARSPAIGLPPAVAATTCWSYTFVAVSLFCIRRPLFTSGVAGLAACCKHSGALAPHLLVTELTGCRRPQFCGDRADFAGPDCVSRPASPPRCSSPWASI